MRVPVRTLALAAVACLVLAPQLHAGDGVDPKAAFERLKTLAGTWQGKGGAPGADQAVTVSYRTASAGSVVQETLLPGTPNEMISMYHMADGQLVMTHYCAMGNQPHMKLDAKASSADRWVFVFDGGTNFDPVKDGHVHSGSLTLTGDRLAGDWVFWAGGKEAGHHAWDVRRSQ
jgi:hypothetical protein